MLKKLVQETRTSEMLSSASFSFISFLNKFLECVSGYLLMRRVPLYLMMLYLSIDAVVYISTKQMV